MNSRAILLWRMIALHFFYCKVCNVNYFICQRRIALLFFSTLRTSLMVTAVLAFCLVESNSDLYISELFAFRYGYSMELNWYMLRFIPIQKLASRCCHHGPLRQSPFNSLFLFPELDCVLQVNFISVSIFLNISTL